MPEESVNQNRTETPNLHRGRGAKRSKILKRPRIISGIVLLALIVLASGLYFYMHRNNGPLPQSVVKNASFPLYYPAPMPAGYSYVKNSAKLTAGVLFFAISSGSQHVSISEETVPPSPPNLSRLTGFTSLQTFAGSAAIGSSNGSPVGIVLSNTTLIIVNGNKQVPSEIVSDIVRSLNVLSTNQNNN